MAQKSTLSLSAITGKLRSILAKAGGGPAKSEMFTAVDAALHLSVVDPAGYRSALDSATYRSAVSYARHLTAVEEV